MALVAVLTLPFALGEVDLYSLGVSDAELATVGPQAAPTAAGDDNLLIVDDDFQNCPNAEFVTVQSLPSYAPGTGGRALPR